MIKNTSQISFHSLGEKRTTQIQEVLEAIKRYPDKTDYEIGIITGIARHLIPDRRGKLEKRGQVFESGQRHCTISGKLASTWRVVERPDMRSPQVIINERQGQLI